MKRIFTLLCVLIGSLSMAQTGSRAVVANGGVFEFSPPYSDFATIGVYDYGLDTYWTFDTIRNQSVQDLVIVDSVAYLASQDSIIKYDLKSYQRLGVAYFQNVGTLSIHDTLLFVGKLFGTGDYLSVYDSRDLSFLYSVAEINTVPHDVVVINDSAYVAYNQKGTIDQWPPYQIFNDTIGKIGVLNLSTQSFVRDISLDTIGAGIQNLFTYGDSIITVSNFNGEGALGYYNLTSNALSFDTLNVSNGLHLMDTVLYADLGAGIGTYDIKNGDTITITILNKDYITSALDTAKLNVFLNQSDYSSFGKSFFYDISTTTLDSFDVAISPEAIAIEYGSWDYSFTLMDDFKTVSMDADTVIIDVLANDLTFGQVSSMIIIDSVDNGFARIADNKVKFIPNSSFVGKDTLLYKVCDGSANCDSAYLFIDVVYTPNYFSNIIIANGGKFEIGAPYDDRATIGAYDPVKDKYWVFDTIYVESVQDLAIANGYAYLAAQDSVIRYSLTTYKRSGEIAFAGVNSVYVKDDLLFVGKNYGTGSFLSVYDVNTLTLQYSIPEITSTVHDVVVVGDSAYVAYNQKGTIDLYPPFQVFADTLGKIGVIELNGGTYSRTIELDTIGAGIRSVFSKNNQIIGVCEENGTIVKYSISSGIIDFDTLAISNAIGLKDNDLYASYNGQVGAYDIDSESMMATNLLSYNYIESALDSISNNMYFAATDYASYGRVYSYSLNGSFNDSIAVNISPEAIAVDYKDGNYAPIALNDYATVPENDSGRDFNVLVTDFDPNGDDLTISILNTAQLGVAAISGDKINYIPNENVNGVDTIVYQICDTESACDQAKLVIQITPSSSIKELTQLVDLMVFPNPASGNITVKAKGEGVKQLTILDVKGAVVYQEKLLNNSSVVNLGGLETGVYMVQLTSLYATETIKLIIQ